MAAGAYFAWYPFDQSTIDETVQSLPEAASLDIKKGTPVILNSDGRVEACGTAPSLIYGVALEVSHNGVAGANNILIARLRVGDVWVMPLLEALAQNLFGVAAGEMGIVKDATTGYWYGSTADAGDQARVVDYVPPPAGLTFGDTVAPVKAIFHSTKIQAV